MAAEPMDNNPVSLCSRINLRMHRLRLKQRRNWAKTVRQSSALQPNTAHSGLVLWVWQAALAANRVLGPPESQFVVHEATVKMAFASVTIGPSDAFQWPDRRDARCKVSVPGFSPD